MDLKFWSRNAAIIDDPYINPTFHELLQKSEDELTKWIEDSRSKILKVWDETGTPPLSGLALEEMQDEFRQMRSYKVLRNFQRKDQLDGENNIILNPSHLGSCVNQFFPTMLKTKINYNSSHDGSKFSGYSVYDLFANDRFYKRCQLGFRRHFRRDSFYKYSISIEKETDMGVIRAKSGSDWVGYFRNPNFRQQFEGYDFWLNEVDPENNKGSGYTEIDADKFLWLSYDDILTLQANGHITKENLANVGTVKPGKQYHIRMYKKDARIYPMGFTAFKIGYIQVAVNFPPLIAKFLYSKYTKHIKEPRINIFDPSSGWGGRIVGAMSMEEDRHIHYIGTDPNTDNILASGQSRYAFIADTFLDAVAKDNLIVKWMGGNTHTHQVFRQGSEEIGKDPEFQKYKGKIDLVFTSPPYFAKELYSEDPEQSATKYNTLDTWVQGFLRPTLTTAVAWLKKDRYLLWNIADVKMGDKGTYLPLEQLSSDILKELGMTYVGVEKMALMNMPGSNRVIDGKPSAKNFCKIEGKWRKYEPVFVWKKN